jgi:hypothetical protein
MGGSKGVKGGKSSKIEPIGLWFLRVLKWKTAREVKRTRCKSTAVTQKSEEVAQGISILAGASAAQTIARVGDKNEDENDSIASGESFDSNDEIDVDFFLYSVFCILILNRIRCLLCFVF